VAAIVGVTDLVWEQHLDAEYAELCRALGVAKNSGANKSARIRALLGLSLHEPELTRRSILEQNPFAWLVALNGIPVDARTLPSELQDEPRRLGLIPDLDHRRAA
jgi:hypothetical protein